MLKVITFPFPLILDILLSAATAVSLVWLLDNIKAQELWKGIRAAAELPKEKREAAIEILARDILTYLEGRYGKKFTNV